MDDASELKEAAKLYCEAMAFFLPAIECKLIASVSNSWSELLQSWQRLDEIVWLTDEKDPEMKTRLRERVSHITAKVI